jgi:hypothetical protein
MEWMNMIIPSHFIHHSGQMLFRPDVYRIEFTGSRYKFAILHFYAVHFGVHFARQLESGLCWLWLF